MSNITGGLAKLAIIVVAIALVGGGTAAAAGKLSGGKLKAGSVAGSKLKKGTIGLDRLSSSAKAALKGDRGPAGPAGAAGADGAQGAQGPQGPRGPSDAFVRTKATQLIDNANSRTVLTQNLPAGTYLVNAKLAATAAGSGLLDCRLRTGVATDFDTSLVDVIAADREQVVLSGTVTIPAGATGTADDARILCFGDQGALNQTTVAQLSLSAIQVANVTATGE